jgi:hypothetical protein
MHCSNFTEPGIASVCAPILRGDGIPSKSLAISRLSSSHEYVERNAEFGVGFTFSTDPPQDITANDAAHEPSSAAALLGMNRRTAAIVSVLLESGASLVTLVVDARPSARTRVLCEIDDSDTFWTLPWSRVSV